MLDPRIFVYAKSFIESGDALTLLTRPFSDVSAEKEVSWRMKLSEETNEHGQPNGRQSD